MNYNPLDYYPEVVEIFLLATCRPQKLLDIPKGLLLAVA